MTEAVPGAFPPGGVAGTVGKPGPNDTLEGIHQDKVSRMFDHQRKDRVRKINRARSGLPSVLQSMKGAQFLVVTDFFLQLDSNDCDNTRTST